MPDQQPLLEKFGAVPVAAALLALVLLAWLALRPLLPPHRLGSGSPAAEFAVTRALPAFRALSQAPRPVASAANAQARAYIVERLLALQLEPEVQTATARQIGGSSHAHYRVSLGVVHNVLVRLHGSAPDRASLPALLVAAHYDSAPDRLGAADASAPVAAMLETLRALQHGAPLANDVIFLFADAGKSGGLGARAFAGQHRWSRDVGLVLQFDAAGNSGPLLLTGSRGGNGRLVAGWAEAAPLPVGSSALAVLARQSPALQAHGALDQVGLAGLHFANIEGGSGYSGASDMPGKVARATMQHAGETMLALTRHFGSTPLAGIGAADSVHFELPVAGQVQYSTDYVWPITRTVCFLFLLACCMAVKYLDLEPQMLIAGAMAFVMLVLVLASIAITLWQGWPELHRGYNPMAVGASERDSWYFLAYVTLGSALFIELQRLMHKALGTPAITLGALLVMLVALVGASWVAPGASYLLAWPMLASLLAFGLLNMPRVKAWPQPARLALMVGAAAPAVLLIAPLLQQVSTLFTPQRSALLMIVLSLMLGLGTTLLAAVRRRFVAPVLIAVCAGALMTAQGIAPRDSQLARPNHMTYLKDAYSWNAWWLMPAGPLDAWSQPFFAGASGPRELREAYRATGQPLWVASAPGHHVAFPDLVALSDSDAGGRRHVAFSLRSINRAPTIELRVEGAEVLSSRINGQVLTARPALSWSLKLHGTGAQKHHIELELPGGGAARVFVAERIPGLPGKAGGARPAHIPTEMTVATDMLVFR